MVIILCFVSIDPLDLESKKIRSCVRKRLQTVEN
jgi:hypothetical protein